MADSWLQDYADELVRLRRDENLTLDKIIQYMETHHQRRVAKSTLSVFLRSLPAAREPGPPNAPRVSPEEQTFLAQAEVLEYVRHTSETLVDGLARLHARQGELEDAAAERHRAVLAALQRVEEALRALAGQRPTPGSPPDALGVEVLLGEVQRQTQALDGLRGLLLAPPVVHGPPPLPPPAPAPVPPPRRWWHRWLGAFLGGMLTLWIGAALCVPYVPTGDARLVHAFLWTVSPQVSLPRR